MNRCDVGVGEENEEIAESPEVAPIYPPEEDTKKTIEIPTLPQPIDEEEEDLKFKQKFLRQR